MKGLWYSFITNIRAMAFKSQKLEVWKLATHMADDIHNLTRAFPKEELFSLTIQIKRAADSISLNIAAGSTGQPDAEQAKFSGYAQRSALEVVNCLYLAVKRKCIDEVQFSAPYTALENLVIKIQALKNALKKVNHP